LPPAFSQKQYFVEYRNKCDRKVGVGSIQELDFKSELLEWGSALGSAPELPLPEKGGMEGGRDRGTMKSSESECSCHIVGLPTAGSSKISFH